MSVILHRHALMAPSLLVFIPRVYVCVCVCVCISVSAVCHFPNKQHLFLKSSLYRRSFIIPQRFSDQLLFEKVHIIVILEKTLHAVIQKLVCIKFSAEN